MTIMDPREHNSTYAAPWLATISAHMEEGWRAIYSDGSGSEGHAAAAAHMMTRRTEPPRTTSSYLGPIATSGDAELQGLLLALQLSSDLDQVLILSDSQASIASLHKLARGTQPPRSHIETQIKAALQERGSANMDTGISWVRSHIGMEGNEKADTEAGMRSYLGRLTSEPYIATEASGN